MSARSHRSSIQGKIVRLMCFAITLCVIFIGGIGLISAQKIINNTTAQYIYAHADAERASINGVLAPISQSVDILAQSLEKDLTDVSLLSDEEFLNAYIERKENTILTAAEVTDGAVAVYLRFDPELTNPTAGLFYERQHLVNGYQEVATTDLSLYDEDDEEVTWFYVPKEAGQEVWMAPYYNRNIDVYMISYIVPLYKDGVFFGVIGMDIRYEYITDMVSEISIYDSGYAYLVSENGYLYWHPELEVGSRAPEDETLETVTVRLANGMYLVLAAPKSEINHERNMLILQIALFAFGIVAIFTLLAIVTSRSMILPLRRLNEAAKTMSEGDKYVELPVTTNDEIGELTESFNITGQHLKEYSEYIKRLAYKDGLTSVRNRTAFEQTLSEMTAELLSNPDMEFAIAVMDVNNLKEVNDSLGHEGGDELLINCCRMICRIYSHSPVFRIGGDEFVAILRGEDFENRNILHAKMKQMMDEAATKEKATQRLSVASGTAVYLPALDDTIDDVFRRADALMYENKKLMKEQMKKHQEAE